MTSLYSHDVILVLFEWNFKQDYNIEYLVTETGASLAPTSDLASNEARTFLPKPNDGMAKCPKVSDKGHTTQ